MTKYKSKFEAQIAAEIGDRVQYEPDKLKFVQPPAQRVYIPDWKIADGVYIESKGKFTLDDRKKMAWVKEQYPRYRFYLLFQNAYNRITKRSRTTYAEWAENNGFEWGHFPDGIPQHWFEQGETSFGNQKDNRTGRKNRRSPRKSK